MNRRKRLWARAEAWAARNIDNRVCRFAAAEGFHAGYNAAIRDTLPQRKAYELLRVETAERYRRILELERGQPS